MAAGEFFKKVDEVGPYIQTYGILLLKGYEFTFRPEPEGFVSESDFIPLVWDTKTKDGAADTNMQDNNREQPGFGGASVQDDGGVTSMSVDLGPSAQEGQSLRPSVARLLSGIDLTPFNPSTKTPRGMEIVRERQELVTKLGGYQQTGTSCHMKSPVALAGSQPADVHEVAASSTATIAPTSVVAAAVGDHPRSSTGTV
ncbi:hypothetical protein ZWY2020_013912 [Hordeum vulgare]|nr:hypothetical protein ZWY2020_013912 [Hordeum vulgare]